MCMHAFVYDTVCECVTKYRSCDLCACLSYAFMHACKSESMCVCTNVCVCLCMCAHMYVCLYVCI